MNKILTEAEKLTIVRLIAAGWNYIDVAADYGLTPEKVIEICHDYYGE